MNWRLAIYNQANRGWYVAGGRTPWQATPSSAYTFNGWADLDENISTRLPISISGENNIAIRWVAFP